MAVCHSKFQNIRSYDHASFAEQWRISEFSSSNTDVVPFESKCGNCQLKEGQAYKSFAICVQSVDTVNQYEKDCFACF